MMWLHFSSLNFRQSRLSGPAGKERIDERRDLQNPVRKSDQEKEQRKEENEHRGSVIGRRMGIDEVNQQTPEHVNVGIAHDRIERILDQSLQPSPEEPFHVRHDEKGDEDRAEENRDRGGDVSKTNYRKDGGL